MADNTQFSSYRAQSTYPALVEQGTGFPRINSRSELVVPDFAMQLVQDGAVFHISNAARQTALATGGTSFSDTAPAFIIDFPSGTTGIPLSVTLNQGGTVAGAAITVILTYDVIARYSSGGTAVTVRNMKTGASPRATTVVSAYSTSPTAAAVSQERTLYARLMAQDVTPAVDVEYPGVFHWDYRMAVAPPFLVGPSSLVIYTFAGTTQPSWFFNIVWAEIPTVSV